MPEGYLAPRCATCGHIEGDHGHTHRSLWADYSVAGPCFLKDCDCIQFVAASEESDRAAA